MTEPVGEAVGGFDFDAWASECGLNRETTRILRKHDCAIEETLKILEKGDVNRLELSVGQSRTLMAAISAMNKEGAIAGTTNQTEGDDQPIPQTHAVPEDITAMRRQATLLDQAGKEIDTLLGENEDLLGGSALPTLPGGDAGARGSHEPARCKRSK